MAKVHGLLDIGRRSMQLSQSALNTTSHNIANKSTEKEWLPPLQRPVEHPPVLRAPQVNAGQSNLRLARSIYQNRSRQ